MKIMWLMLECDTSITVTDTLLYLFITINLL